MGPLVLLFDEIQVFSSAISTFTSSEYKNKMTKLSDALLLGLYNSIGFLAKRGYEARIFCCLAGSHSELANLFILSPLKQDPDF
jgi:hypothetical protein